MTKHYLGIFFFLVCPFFATVQLNAQSPEYFSGKAGEKLDWTLFYLNSHYVDSTDADRLTELAIIRILKELDPFSRYQSKKQIDDQRKADEGFKNDGLGFKYYYVNDTATVTYIDATGPGVAAGLLKGDKILSINNANAIGTNYGLLENALIADRGTKFDFKIRRNNGTPFDLSVTSISLFAASLDAAYKIDGDIGYIRLNRFTMKTVGEVQDALKVLKAEGVKNLIIDLRDNRGGTVVGARNLVDEFLPEGKLIMASEGKGMPREEIYATANGLFENGKVAILTNTATASASEIFTGAMQEWDRALVLGEVTYGKGLIQQSYIYGDSSAVRLTIGRYYTPTGRMLQRPFNFDSTKDWIFQNIANAVHVNGFTTQLDAPPANKMKTKSGRTILKGQGSIIPDIYLTPKVINKPQLTKLNKLRIIYRFVVYHADVFRPYYLYTYKNGNEFRYSSVDDEGIRRNFEAFIHANLEDKDLVGSVLSEGVSPHVMTQIKAWLAPQIWEIGDYFSILNEKDDLVNRAIQSFTDGTFEKVGIKTN